MFHIRIFIMAFLLISISSASAFSAEEITQEKVEQALVAYLEKHAPVGVEMVEWRFQHRSPLPLKGRIVDFEGPVDSRWRSQIPLKITVENYSGGQQTFWLTVQLVFSRGIVVATRNLPMGHRLTRQDMSIEIREGWRYLNNDYSKMDEIIGKEIWRPISKGTSIKNYHIKQAENIQRGDTVKIIAEKGSLRIEAPGRVLENGEPGQMIRVVNTLSGKEIYANIIDAQTVSVSF